MNTAPKPVPEFKPDRSAVPEPLDEGTQQFEASWYPWAGRVARKFSQTGLFFFAAYLGLIAFVVNVPSRDMRTGIEYDARYWVVSLTMAAFISALTGLLLGVHARRTKEGRQAIVAALPSVALIIAAIAFFR